MPSFIEQATLRVVDQSSRQISKINAELQKLQRTANALKSTKIDLGNLSKAHGDVRKLTAEMQRLHAAGARAIPLRVNTAQAQQQLAALRTQAQSPITIAARAAATGGGGRAAAPGRPGGLLAATGALNSSFGGLAWSATKLAAIFGTIGAGVAVARAGVQAVVASEDARMRLQQSGFTPEQTDLFMEYARRSQEQFKRIPAAAIANASVEQLNAIKAANGSFADYQLAMDRIARNAQIMGVTFKDPTEGAESARQLERVSQILGKDVDRAEIQKVQEAAMRAIIATGGEMKAAEMVRALQQLGSSIAKSMSAQALTDIMMIRDEGGRQSTAEWRMAVQELMRGSLNPDDKAAMAKHGLRNKRGGMLPSIVNEASSDLVGFTEKRIVPILKAAGKAEASSAEIAAHLDEVVGYTTSGARALADIVTSLRDGELQRQRAAARAVELSPHLGDRSFRGGAERLKAEFDTALARPLDKMGGAFADAVAPFASAMNLAGKKAEKGEFAGAAAVMTEAGLKVMGGPVGQIAATVAALNAARTMIDPTASTAAKGAALLVTGATTLGLAAGALLKKFGKEDPKEELAKQQTRAQTLTAEIAKLEKDKAEEEQKGRPRSTALKVINDNLALARMELKQTQGDIQQGEERVRALTELATQLAAEERSRMERLERESGLAPKPAAVAAAIAAGIETPVPGGFPTDPATATAVKQAATAAATAAKQALAVQRAMFPAYRKVDTKERVPAGVVPQPRARPTEAPARVSEAPAAANTLAEALDRMRTTEPAWLDSYKTATKETPAWVTGFKEASAETGLAGTKFASAATTMNDAGNTLSNASKVNFDSALKIIEANATYTSSATTLATSQASNATSLASSTTSLASFGTSFASSVSALTAAGPTFAQVFGTAATAIGNAGTAAADALAGRAGGIGSIIGNSAGDALAARVSGLSINVNANVNTKPNTGEMRPD